ncbi:MULTISPECIES: hypothetical protein [unclassified Mycobacterium]|uniref:hypothetical protein n=1 Tax=unclassified Mycobacterium TaxID=2642494 RepID=UPI0029C8C9CE|nr:MULTISPECIES: hypothetical protein [unclassified Mycobacterium]
MGRHSASYIAGQQALSTGTAAGGAARYVGRVGGLALALGIGAAVAGGAGLAHADGTVDAKHGPAADGGTPNDVDSPTKTKKPKLGLFNAPKVTLGSQVPDPGSLSGMISKLPQRIAGLVADHTPGADGASTPTTDGRAAPKVSTRGSSRHRADFSHAGPTADSKVPQFSAAAEDVATKLHTGTQSLGLAPSSPSAPDPAPPQRLNVSSDVTAFAGPATTQSTLVATTVSNLLGSLGGVSGSGGSPVAPGQVILGALQLLRRELDRPSTAQTLSLTSIGTLFHPAPAPVVPAPPTDTAPATTPYLPADTVSTPYGNIGKWMLQSNGQISNYGGQPYDGKTMLEPVNVIIVDPNSKSAAESTAKINRDMFLAGFPAQPIHSSGFLGLIGSKTYGQQALPLTAYSDNLFIFQNDHGRLFGPAPAPDGGYVWTGAFSTETPTIYNGLPTHAYVSSDAARDALVLRLLATGQVQSISYIPLDNAVDTDTTTTGDHDGYAVVIVLK